MTAAPRPLRVAATAGELVGPGSAVSGRPFPWRGVLLDVARHLLPVDYIERFLDAMALLGLNRLHLHLTDDQGWRLTVPGRPALTDVGAWRTESQQVWGDATGDGTPHGGCYTDDDLRRIVEHAAARGIVVVPEIDLPGHTTAAIAAYPELGNTDVSGPHAVATTWGVMDATLNLEQATLEFCEEVLDHVLDVFPSPWIHVGGDECRTTEWEQSPRARDRMAQLGIRDFAAAQTWWTGNLTDLVRARGRRPVVWDDAVHPGLPRDVLVMAWRDSRFGLEAAGLGFDVIMTPCQWTYYDWYQSTDPDEPAAQPGVTTLQKAYAFDPFAGCVDPAVTERIVGVQGALWAEFLPTPDRLSDMAFPRLIALAEIAQRRPGTSFEEFVGRARALRPRLAELGLAGRPLWS